MALLASAVVTAARDAHPAFTTGRVPAPVAWRQLQRIHARLVALVARQSPDVLTATTQTTALPLATFASGITISGSVLQPLDVHARDSQGNDSLVELVPFSARATAFRHPAATLSGSLCLLLGEAEWWTPWVSVLIRYVPQPTTALTDGTTLALPDDALDACAALLSAQMATRLVENGQPLVANAGQLLSDARDAEALFLERIGAYKRPQTLRVREVF